MLESLHTPFVDFQGRSYGWKLHPQTGIHVLSYSTTLRVSMRPKVFNKSIILIFTPSHPPPKINIQQDAHQYCNLTVVLNMSEWHPPSTHCESIIMTIMLGTRASGLGDPHQTQSVYNVTTCGFERLYFSTCTCKLRIEALWCQLRKHTTGWWINAFKVWLAIRNYSYSKQVNAITVHFVYIGDGNARIFEYENWNPQVRQPQGIAKDSQFNNHAICTGNAWQLYSFHFWSMMLTSSPCSGTVTK